MRMEKKLTMMQLLSGIKEPVELRAGQQQQGGRWTPMGAEILLHAVPLHIRGKRSVQSLFSVQIPADCLVGGRSRRPEPGRPGHTQCVLA